MTARRPFISLRFCDCYLPDTVYPATISYQQSAAWVQPLVLDWFEISFALLSVVGHYATKGFF
jgi:hypothetical protein